MSSSSALTKTVSTPVKAAAAAPTESPGKWRHPRLDEITRRQEQTSFSEKNVRSITINLGVLVALFATNTLLHKLFPSTKSFLPQSLAISQYSGLIWKAILVIPVVQILINLLPLWRKPDELADIPLTSAQRQLLGLPPSSAPPTPGSVYSTPPRYSRTPSISGSASSKRSFSGSPQSNRATPSKSEFGSPLTSSGNGLKASILGSPSSPLLHKAIGGARRSSLGGSMGPPSPLGISTASSIFGSGGPESPSPTPTSGKRSTVGLNNKWLYEKGRDRRSSGNNWLLS
ncbi:nuclear pore complex component-domain-containing protein [Microdochium trichocladiopsis]|uniref:Nuclear pore complex component-domain-containing protein n=1 Tax=Microdochium trichocladiopsis TaxID=1682393 RepID=A0A9P9BRY3_9PEZI|nr:nuclear pore complex component-domain-containing protein [Microdochium trichocladiopsis]KAH7033416.1 nuclear pore complex component-domain-containing protein [Microdochium trichocladiopsis]